MMYKTSSPDHRPSIGILMDLIRKHGAKSAEVAAYMENFSNNADFIKKASLLINMGSVVDSLKNPAPENK